MKHKLTRAHLEILDEAFKAFHSRIRMARKMAYLKAVTGGPMDRRLLHEWERHCVEAAQWLEAQIEATEPPKIVAEEVAHV